jgi:type I restriction enzyme S subunit
MITRTVQLGGVMTIDRASASEAECRTLPYVGLEHIEKNAGNFVTDFRPRPEDLLATKFRFTCRHVLYGKLRPNLNKVVIPQFDGVCTTEIFPLLPQQNVLDRGFLYGVLLSPRFVAWASNSVSGANLPRLDPDRLREYEFELPDLTEQRRIARQLEKADQLRRVRRYSLELTDNYLPAAFLELFGDPLSNPKGWEKKPLGEICTIRRGASPRPIDSFLGGSVPWIKIGDGTKGDRIYITSTEDHVTDAGAAKSVFLSRGSLIFANCGVTCGFARLLKIDGCIHDGWLAFQEFERVLDPLFFLQAINQLTPHLRGLAPEGTQPNLNTGIMSDFALVVPPLPLQQKFAAIVKQLERLRAVQREALRLSEHLFGSLLHRGFGGA